jgi:AcrR family transcriptional regulator
MSKAPRKKAQPDRYHHGDLRIALIAATDRLLASGGLEAFSLREAAKIAGVSPAAPAHHFGGAAGLLSEVAALGFADLAKELRVDAAGLSPTQRLRRQGMGYVRFAANYPGRFQLMFRRELLDEAHEGLQQAGGEALAELERTIRARRALSSDEPLDGASRAAVFAAWSVVHGFAHLLLDGKLGHLHHGASTDALIDRLLPAVLLDVWPD